MLCEVFGFVLMSAGRRTIVPAFVGVHPCVHIIFMSVRKSFDLLGMDVSASFARRSFNAFRFLGGFGCDHSVVELVREFFSRVGVVFRGAIVPMIIFVRRPFGGKFMFLPERNRQNDGAHRACAYYARNDD